MIYIVNRYERLPFGHFWNADYDIRKALRELEIEYVYLNPTANLAEIEDEVLPDDRWKYKIIPDGTSFVHDCLNFIEQNEIGASSSNTKIFLPWVPMFTEHELQAFSLDSSEGAPLVYGLSMPTSDATLGHSRKFRYYGQEIFENKDNFKLLWVGEKPIRNDDDKLEISQWVDFINFRFADPLRNPKKISFFGLLGQQRGIAEILLISLFNPNTLIEIKGYSYSKLRIFRPFKYKSLRYSSWKKKPWLAIPFSAISFLIDFLRNLPNVIFSKTPFSNEFELSYAISMTGAIFYHAKYSYGSGIAMKSLNSGVPVIWIGSQGYAFEILNRHFPEGRIQYRDIFIPGRVSKKLAAISNLKPTSPYSWNDYLLNLSILGD